MNLDFSKYEAFVPETLYEQNQNGDMNEYKSYILQIREEMDRRSKRMLTIIGPRHRSRGGNINPHISFISDIVCELIPDSSNVTILKDRTGSLSRVETLPPEIIIQAHQNYHKRRQQHENA